MVSTHCQPSALGTSECTVPAVPGDAWIGTPSGTKRAVVFLMHGINGLGVEPPVIQPTDVPILTYYIGTLATDLVNAGFVVVWGRQVGDFNTGQSQVAAIYNDVNNDPNTTKGTRHAAAIAHHADHLDNWATLTYPGLPRVIGGMSWGGMQTLQMVTQRPSYWNGYFAHHPASVLSKINPNVGEDFTGFTSSGLDIASTAFNAINIPGYFGWGTTDTAVDYPNSGDSLTPAIYNAAHGAGMPVTSNQQTEAHVMSTTDVTAIMTWAGSTPNSGQLPF